MAEIIELDYERACIRKVPFVSFVYLINAICYVYLNIWSLKLQGYAAREFAKQGVNPGELAIISKEAVCLILLLSTRHLFNNLEFEFDEYD